GRRATRQRRTRGPAGRTAGRRSRRAAGRTAGRRSRRAAGRTAGRRSRATPRGPTPGPLRRTAGRRSRATPHGPTPEPPRRTARPRSPRAAGRRAPRTAGRTHAAPPAGPGDCAHRRPWVPPRTFPRCRPTGAPARWARPRGATGTPDTATLPAGLRLRPGRAPARAPPPVTGTPGGLPPRTAPAPAPTGATHRTTTSTGRPPRSAASSRPDADAAPGPREGARPGPTSHRLHRLLPRPRAGPTVGERLARQRQRPTGRAARGRARPRFLPDTRPRWRVLAGRREPSTRTAPRPERRADQDPQPARRRALPHGPPPATRGSRPPGAAPPTAHASADTRPTRVSA